MKIREFKSIVNFMPHGEEFFFYFGITKSVFLDMMCQTDYTVTVSKECSADREAFAIITLII